jgi:aminoglycoside phosphotransferase (APT) family kinase protein
MAYHLPGPDRPPLAELAGAGTGIPTEAEYVAEYCRHTGQTEIPNFGFYLAFSAFRYASIVQGVVKRGLSGNASSGKEAMTYVTRVKVSATKGWELAEKA